MNITVGPNNCGKSTILGAFRALDAAIRRARSKSAEIVPGPDGEVFGHRITEESLPISIENVHTDYNESNSTVIFRFSNRTRLKLYFPSDKGCILFLDTNSKSIRTPSEFRKIFPFTIGVVPVLGPVEHDEMILKENTVKRDLASHRASRHFRNFWYHFPDGFEDFSSLVRKTWPGMDIQKPEKLDYRSAKLSMFCQEKRIDRELYWAGFGFQVWCQLVTHIVRSQENSIIIIDEPEIYLHPDVQRQLLGILRNVGPDIMIATHSTEIMSEADPSEILLVAKESSSAKRLRDIKEVQTALDTVGSIQNITLTKLAQSQKLLFLEGSSDYNIIRRFAAKIGLSELATGNNITAIVSEGFSSWKKIRAFAWGMNKAIDRNISIGAIFDSDYWPPEQVSSILQDLKNHVTFAHIHKRKEIENYLMIPNVLQRVLDKNILKKAKRSGNTVKTKESISVLIEKITNPMKTQLQGQYIAKRTKFLKRSKEDDATITAETIDTFEKKWNILSTRMEIVPGKEVLQKLRSVIQDKYSVNLTDYQIIDEFKIDDIPTDLSELIKKIDTFRCTN